MALATADPCGPFLFEVGAVAPNGPSRALEGKRPYRVSAFFSGGCFRISSIVSPLSFATPLSSRSIA